MKLSIKHIFFLSLLSIAQHSNLAIAQEPFPVWLDGIRADARTSGISDQTVNTVIDHVQLVPDVIQLDHSQPEFISPFLSYYYQRVDAAKIMKGRALLAEHHALLNQLEVQYGVPKTLLLAFWGMETHYGANKGNLDTLSALATLAYDGRRAAFFRSQLLDAMRMIDAGYVDVAEFRGSWAGAFGHMQFMPTTFMLYAVDGDQDGKIDVANSMPDAFASAAKYLSQVGWRVSEPAMIEVQLPAEFAWQEAQLSVRKTMEEWTQLGVRALQMESNSADRHLMNVYPVSEVAASKSTVSKSTDKQTDKRSRYLKSAKWKSAKKAKNRKPVQQVSYVPQTKVDSTVTLLAELPDVTGQAAILLPQGWRGPAFMVFDNFDVIMDWNRSVNYALSVAQLAKRIDQQSRIIGGQLAEQGALSFEQMMALQKALNARGFDAGMPDGLPGLKTQDAIRAYQLSQQLPADGYASPTLYNRLIPELISEQ